MPNLQQAKDNLAALRAPSEAIRLPAILMHPGAADPARDVTVPGLTFRKAATDVAYAAVQIPDSWFPRSPLTLEFRWSKTTSAAGNVYWQAEYKWAPTGVNVDAAFTAIGSAAPVVSDADTSGRVALTRLAAIDAYDRSPGDILLLKVARVHNHAGDTYAASARLIEVALRFKTNGYGGV
jgi:hypothetical protein